MVYIHLFILLICVILLSATAVVQGGYVFHPEIQRHLKQHKQVATWEEAKKHCENEGAILVSPTDGQLLKYMKRIISVNNHTTPYFIGIKAKHDEDTQFVSEEGILIEEIPEAIDLVEQLDSRNGDCLCMDGHSIRVVPCWTRLPYICYKNVTEDDATTTEIPTTNSPQDCNTGYKLNSETGSYYKFFYDKNAAYWDEANSTCAAEGGYLVILNNFLEAQMVKYIAFPLGSYSWAYAYVGLLDSGNNDWRSIHGDSIENLHRVFKQTQYSIGNCGVLRFDGQLERYSCYDKLPFVCEKQVLNPC